MSRNFKIIMANSEIRSQRIALVSILLSTVSFENNDKKNMPNVQGILLEQLDEVKRRGFFISNKHDPDLEHTCKKKTYRRKVTQLVGFLP